MYRLCYWGIYMAERVFLKLWIIEFEGTIYMILYWSQVGLRTQEGQSNTLPHSKTSRYPILSTLFHSFILFGQGIKFVEYVLLTSSYTFVIMFRYLLMTIRQRTLSLTKRKRRKTQRRKKMRKRRRKTKSIWLSPSLPFSLSHLSTCFSFSPHRFL